MASDRRSAYTLLELLVVIGILCFLMALLLPAVNSPRGASRNSVCKNRLSNLALASLVYDDQHGRFPGYRETLTTQSGQQIRVSWVIPLLPQLERNDLYSAWKACPNGDTATGDYQFPARSSASPLVYMPVMVCPSDPQAAQPAGNSQPTSYVVNAGMQDYQATSDTSGDFPENGPFVSRWERPQSPPLKMAETSNAFIAGKDGTSNTILMSENIEARYYNDAPAYVNEDRNNSLSGSPKNPTAEQYTTMHWTNFLHFPGGRLDSSVLQERINGLPQNGTNPSPGVAYDITYARPSSNHPGGVNVAFCDRHVTFVNGDIDYLVFALLMTPDGANSRNSRTGLPNPAPFRQTQPSPW